MCDNSSRVVALGCSKFHACIAEPPASLHEELRKLAIFTVGMAEAKLEEGFDISDLPLDAKDIGDVIDRVCELSRLTSSRSAVTVSITSP